MNGAQAHREATKVAAREVEPNRRFGAPIRVLLSPGTARTTAGIMALLDLPPGERVSEHYHPYTDEHVYVTDGRLVAVVNGTELVVDARESLLIRRGARHRYENRGDRPLSAVIFFSPLAPSPELGHVETEKPARDEPPPSVGTPPSAGTPPTAGERA